MDDYSINSATLNCPTLNFRSPRLFGRSRLVVTAFVAWASLILSLPNAAIAQSSNSNASSLSGAVASDADSFGTKGFGTSLNEGSLKPSKDSGFGGFGLNGFGGGQKSVRFSATYQKDLGSDRGLLSVKAVLEPLHYISSVTQAAGGPIRTKISPQTDSIELVGEFEANVPPKTSTNEPGFEGIRVDKHFGEVTWTANILFEKGTFDQDQTILVRLDSQVCKDACVPIVGEMIEATFDGFYGIDPKAIELLDESMAFRDEDARTTWTIVLSQNKAVPGDRIDLIATAVSDPGFHLYAVRPKDPETEASTVFVVSEKAGLSFGPPIPSTRPTEQELIPGALKIRYHDGQVSWSIPIRVPLDAKPGTRSFDGMIGYQACTETSCEQPLGLRFSGTIEVVEGAQNSRESDEGTIEASGVGSQTTNGERRRISDADTETGLTSLKIEPISFASVVQAPNRLTWFEDQSPSILPSSIEGKQLFSILALAMLGGFVLNFMPCVLPVIGLKVMSFMHEGERSGRKVATLNLWYVAGIVTVFMVLAILTIAVRASTGQAFGWGEQFGFFGLRLGVTILMFAMALSFLGVWEIPIPGFATTQQSNALMKREGVEGAYFKGLLTTILATPCSGPGLGAVFSLTLTQPAWMILLLYFAVGIGMGLPYIFIAIWPNTIRFLPKPGPWMQTFKEVLAFPLLLSTVWFVSTFSDEYRIAVLTCLIFVWGACWWIGRVPAWADRQVKSLHWGGTIAATTLACWFAIQTFGPIQHLIQWRPYREADLVALQSNGKTVMIDFTAKWCQLCQVNLSQVIETKEVASKLEQLGVVPMLADWTDMSQEVKDKLVELQSNSIPLLAIYPAGNGKEPIILRDGISKRQLLTALEKAGPSATREALAADSIQQSNPPNRTVSFPVRTGNPNP